MASIAKQRIKRLLELAKVENDEGLVEKAFEIRERYNISLSNEFTSYICNSCRSYLKGDKVQVRLNSGKSQLNYRCIECGEVNHYGY